MQIWVVFKYIQFKVWLWNMVVLAIENIRKAHMNVLDFWTHANECEIKFEILCNIVDFSALLIYKTVIFKRKMKFTVSY